MRPGACASALALAASLAAAGCARQDMVISNVTHIDGIPFDQYDPAQYDPSADTVITVAAAPAPAPAAPVATAAPVVEPAAASAVVEEAGDDGNLLTSLLDLPLPNPLPPPAAGGISTVALVDGQQLEVELLDPATGNAPGPGTAAAVQVSPLGAEASSAALRAYGDACNVDQAAVQRWLGAGGRVTYRSQARSFVLWTQDCPGLAAYRRG
jgi:hypothetical protein